MQMPATRSETVSLFDRAGLMQLQRDLRLDPRAVRQVRLGWLKHFRPDEEIRAAYPLASRIRPHVLAVESRFDSQQDGATKLLLRTAAGWLVEAVVLRPATGRTTLCLSSQVGCAAACRFCATGQMGVAKNLSAAEIYDQLLIAGQLAAAEGRTIRNLVFMGMGEPFHNEETLYEALEGLAAPDLFHHSLTRILVSTVGIPEAMIRCARRFPRLHLALSLHSVRQAVREQLIPLARRYPLPELRRAVAEVNRLAPGPVMIEYLMLRDWNDSVAEAELLRDWLQGLQVHVNLIPYNPIDAAPHLHGSERPQRDAFANVLKSAGFRTTIRYSLGSDIAAACGQLVRRQSVARPV